MSLEMDHVGSIIKSQGQIIDIPFASNPGVVIQVSAV